MGLRYQGELTRATNILGTVRQAYQGGQKSESTRVSLGSIGIKMQKYPCISPSPRYQNQQVPGYLSVSSVQYENPKLPGYAWYPRFLPFKYLVYFGNLLTIIQKYQGMLGILGESSIQIPWYIFVAPVPNSNSTRVCLVTSIFQYQIPGYFSVTSVSQYPSARVRSVTVVPKSKVQECAW